ncbi:Irregular chiasm C-roughest protein [Eumeta japonica]|uniref:Irregular chiasm C-roughest protein n=1 Tax=Eumeta variegata TaxID=151549 RepID=A0A4C1ZLI0_EUMVA|nr:Irregular chiasm C-roughest protein [Eumeta japonica]
MARLPAICINMHTIETKWEIDFNDLFAGEPAIRSRYARLTVLVSPEPPRISEGSFLSTTEDREIQLECLSVGGKPPAEFSMCDLEPWRGGAGAGFNVYQARPSPHASLLSLNIVVWGQTD